MIYQTPALATTQVVGPLKRVLVLLTYHQDHFVNKKNPPTPYQKTNIIKKKNGVVIAGARQKVRVAVGVVHNCKSLVIVNVKTIQQGKNVKYTPIIQMAVCERVHGWDLEVSVRISVGMTRMVIIVGFQKIVVAKVVVAVIHPLVAVQMGLLPLVGEQI